MQLLQKAGEEQRKENGEELDIAKVIPLGGDSVTVLTWLTALNERNSEAHIQHNLFNFKPVILDFHASYTLGRLIIDRYCNSCKGVNILFYFMYILN